MLRKGILRCIGLSSILYNSAVSVTFRCGGDSYRGMLDACRRLMTRFVLHSEPHGGQTAHLLGLAARTHMVAVTHWSTDSTHYLRMATVSLTLQLEL